VVNSLARRDWQSVMVPLQKATRDEQKRVRIAAVEALSNFPDASNEAFIVEMTKDECKRCQKRAHAARVALAYTLVKAGQKPVAKSIFQKIGSSDAPEAQKKAAKLGIKQLG
jgi:HEAT repeat protein